MEHSKQENKLKIEKVSFSKISEHEAKKLLYNCLDLILAEQRKNNLNLLIKNPYGNNHKKSN